MSGSPFKLIEYGTKINFPPRMPVTTGLAQEGQVYHNTIDNYLYIFQGGRWNRLAAAP